MMNPSPTEIVDLFSFVEMTLIQHAILAGNFPGVTASSVKPKPKKVNKAEVASEESTKPETQVKLELLEMLMGGAINLNTFNIVSERISSSMRMGKLS